MSLIITKKFKRAKAQDDVVRNADSDELNVGDKIWITQYGRNYPYTITKKWKEGWTFWYKAKNDKSGKEEIVAGAFANALDAAEFHVGQKVRHTRFGTIGKVFEIAPDGGIGVQWSNGQAYYGKFHLPLSEIVAVDE